MKLHNNKYKDWLSFANEDIAMVKLAMEDQIYNQVCFHAQQVVEKSLKAFLKAKKGTVPKVHNLIELFNLCLNMESKFESIREACEYLNRFYAPTRYPDAFPGSLKERLPNVDEAKSAERHCLEVNKTVVKILGDS